LSNRKLSGTTSVGYEENRCGSENAKSEYKTVAPNVESSIEQESWGVVVMIKRGVNDQEVKVQIGTNTVRGSITIVVV